MIIPDLPFADYVKADCVTFHKLLAFEDSPRLYQGLYVTKEFQRSTETQAMRIGRATHALILEGRRAFDAGYLVQPETYISEKGEAKEWNGNAAACKVWKEAALARGQTPVSAADYSLISTMAAAVRGHSGAAELLGEGAAEVTVRYTHPELGLTVQGRFDWLSETDVSDLKTTIEFGRLVSDLRRLSLEALSESRLWRTEAGQYIRQLSFYKHLADTEFATPRRYSLLVVEKEPPYRVGVFQAGERILAIADAINQATLIRIADACRTGIWPGGPEGRVQVEYEGPELVEAGEG